VQLLRSSNRQVLDLSEDQELGLGGEARIYLVPGAQGLAAKVYHRPTPEHGAKLAAMLMNPPEDPTAGQGHTSIAWPSELLLSRDDNQQVLGFLMPLVQGMNPIIDFYHPKTRRREHPLFNYLYLLRTARNLELSGWILPMLLERRGVTYLDVTYISAITGTALISRRLPLVTASATEEQRFPWEPRPED